jgi:hypothetical protein
MQQPTKSTSDKIGDVLQSDDMKKLLPWLLAGGAGAIAGGAMTARRKRRGRPDEEGRLSYLARVLGNAALTGGLVVGGGKALQYGAQRLADSAPAPEGQEPMKSPLSSTIGEVASNPLVAGATGVGGLLGFNKTLGSSHLKDMAKAKAAIESNLRGSTVDSLNELSKSDFDKAVQLSNKATKLNYDPMANKATAQLAGLRPLDSIQGTGKVADARRLLAKLMSSSGGRALGSTGAARGVRGGVLGLSALAPSLLYNYFASQPQE